MVDRQNQLEHFPHQTSQFFSHQIPIKLNSNQNSTIKISDKDDYMQVYLL